MVENENFASPVIQIDNLTTGFGQEIIHQNLNFTLYPSEIMGVVGGSGSGKSVLLRTILGLNPVRDGRIILMGQDITHLLSEEKTLCHQSTGILFQSGALYTSLTVAENIKVPLQEIAGIRGKLADEIVALKLKMVGLPLDAAHKYPSELSGGMVKRSALARALALDPKILFLDEPTSGLDPISAESFDRLIRDLHQALGFSVFMISHDLNTLKSLCHRLAVLVNKKMTIGTIPEILKSDDSWIHTYFHGVRAQEVFCRKRLKINGDT